MALYALDEVGLIPAAAAEPGKVYWCVDCSCPLKLRRGKNRFFHFYHIRAAPSCRLYSKTEDHLLAQIQLQKSFSPNVLQIERPFIQINRVADVCWESEKIIFEIQCSPLTEKEAEMRIRDYASAGYHVVWLLDDKRYNKRVLRPAEPFLRRHSTYFLSIKPGLKSDIYDQFEVFSDGKRLKKGKRLLLDLQRIRRMPKVLFKETLFPKQILQLNCPKYFVGDRLYRALHNSTAMQYWRALENQLPSKKPHPWIAWFNDRILLPYSRFLDRLIKNIS